MQVRTGRAHGTQPTQKHRLMCNCALAGSKTDTKAWPIPDAAAHGMHMHMLLELVEAVLVNPTIRRGLQTAGCGIHMWICTKKCIPVLV